MSKMTPSRPDFAADLGSIQNSVTADVGKILELAKSAKEVPSSPKDSDSTVNSENAPAAIRVEDPSPRTERARRISSSKQRDPQEPVVLENVTTRLRRETNELLTEAALRQRLKKIEPKSRQDIMEVALQEWFRRNGYAKGSDKQDTAGDANDRQ